MVTVETQVSKVSTSLSMVLDVFGIFKHIHHEFNRILGSHTLIAMQNLCDMGKRCGCIKCGLRVTCCSP